MTDAAASAPGQKKKMGIKKDAEIPQASTHQKPQSGEHNANGKKPGRLWKRGNHKHEKTSYQSMENSADS